MALQAQQQFRLALLRRHGRPPAQPAATGRPRSEGGDGGRAGPAHRRPSSTSGRVAACPGPRVADPGPAIPASAPARRRPGPASRTRLRLPTSAIAAPRPRPAAADAFRGHGVSAVLARRATKDQPQEPAPRLPGRRPPTGRRDTPAGTAAVPAGRPGRPSAWRAGRPGHGRSGAASSGDAPAGPLPVEELDRLAVRPDEDVLGVEVGMAEPRRRGGGPASGPDDRARPPSRGRFGLSRPASVRSSAPQASRAEQEGAAVLVLAGGQPFRAADALAPQRFQNAGLAQRPRHEAESRRRPGQADAPGNASFALQKGVMVSPPSERTARATLRSGWPLTTTADRSRKWRASVRPWRRRKGAAARVDFHEGAPAAGQSAGPPRTARPGPRAARPSGGS